ncbi:hypothetical protein OF83DRAFT_1118205 [Amylostereum chailletii]|nr:hypothetical protein OF83DRAFT_1118205 [Amylostereum chailletii]
MIAQVSPPAFANVGWRFYLVFAICGFTNALTIWAFFPETKGLKLEEMDDFFSFKNMPLFVPFANYKRVGRLEREQELENGQVDVDEKYLPSDVSPSLREKADVEIEHIA